MSGAPDYEQLKEYSLSDVDIQNALGLRPKLYTPDLHKMKSIDELFDKKGRSVVLYLTTSLRNGHWVCLMRDSKKKMILFWDSYGGYAPDGQRKWLSHAQLVRLKQDQPILSELLKKSGYMISYNPYPYQSHSPDTNTCGKHCITRLKHAHLTEEEYRKMIRGSGKTPDEFVIDYVYSLIGK